MFKLESYRKGIALSTIFNVVNKGLLFLVSVICIYFFGAEGESGIYFYAYNTVFYVATFITNLNPSVIIPESMRIRLKEGDAEAMRFLNMFILLYVAITVVLCMLFLGSPVNAFLLISKFEVDVLTRYAAILWWTIPLLFLITLTNLLTDILVSYKYFTAPMLIGIFNGSCAILSAVIFHETAGIKSLLIGLLVAYSISLVVLVFFMNKKLRWSWNFRLHKIEKRIWKNALFAQSGNFTGTLVVYMPFYLLSGFGSGVITAINLAQQVAALPTALLSNQFVSVAGIKFNELIATGQEKNIREVFFRAGAFLLFLVVPCSAFIFLYTDDILQLLFLSGNQAEKWRTLAADVLRILGFSVPLMLISSLVSRLFMATHRIVEGFWYQTILNVLYIVSLIIAVNKFGIMAYPFTFVGIYALNVLMGFLYQFLYFPYLGFTRLITYFGWLLLANGAIGITLYFMRSAWHGIPGRYGDLLFGATVYLILLAVAAAIMRVHRLADIRLLK